MKELVFDGKHYNIIGRRDTVEAKRAINSIEDEIVNIQVAMKTLMELDNMNDCGVKTEIRAAIRECLNMIDTLRDILN